MSSLADAHEQKGSGEDLTFENTRAARGEIAFKFLHYKQLSIT